MSTRLVWFIGHKALLRAMTQWSYTHKQAEEVLRLLAEASQIEGQHTQARELRQAAATCAKLKRSQAAAQSHLTRHQPRLVAAIDTALRARRVRLGDIAQRSGMSLAYVSMLLRGQRGNAAALARVHTAFKALLSATPRH